MDHNKSKSVTTSVPSISIKFHANAEQIEELYLSDDENGSSNGAAEKTPTASSAPISIGESESSPLKYFPKLGKRSTSIDATQLQDSSPPSDPWRFFSDIKGKITKSVEEKITEIKSRNQEESSPFKEKGEFKVIKDSKESSSVSESEDLSESSISKTCGIISTTEGVEMSSDDETPSLEKDRKEEKSLLAPTPPKGLRQRFRFLRNKMKHEEGTVKVNDLSKLYNINTERIEQALPEESEDVESAIDALEEVDIKNDIADNKIDEKEVLLCLSQKYDNIHVDHDDVINVKEITGKEIKDTFYDCNVDTPKTIFAPTGFVDLRPIANDNRPYSSYFSYGVLFISVIIYAIIHCYSPYTAGFSAGIIIAYIIFKIYLKLQPAPLISPTKQPSQPISCNILDIQAVKEYQPFMKYEGWVNEYPDVYNPETYHISQTQSVFLRLQGNLLRLSHSRSKIPKRAMWNEPEIKTTFSHHRIYNLLGATVTLLPEKLAKKRHWSKKYPICITLAKDQMSFDTSIFTKLKSEIEKITKKTKEPIEDIDSTANKDRKGLSRFRKKEYPVLSQRFSKLTEDVEMDFDSDSRASTPSADNSDVADSPAVDDEEVYGGSDIIGDVTNVNEEFIVNPVETIPTGSKIYLFGRTDREKEDWFRRLSAATHKEICISQTDSNDSELKVTTVDDGALDAAQMHLEYMKYMNVFKSAKKSTEEKENNELEGQEEKIKTSPNPDEVLWLNSLLGRVLFDCMRDQNFTNRVKERIERKLSTIKLPYFIEELLIPELSLGRTSPLIQSTSKPVVDERGLWIDLGITYEGAIVLTLQTKLNLMRLKNPPAYDKSESKVRSAIYNSDVDDSAESSSDEEGPQEIPNLLQDSSGASILGTGSSGSGNSGKKFIKMVDRIAESKFFQAATENRYIKKAMEGVSNTDLRLTVQVKSIVGTLVLNIPAPPSDRIWLGFRPLPEIVLSARPIVGERNISYIMVTSWIEKKLLQEFQKILVIPNMEDFVIPVMNPKLPD